MTIATNMAGRGTDILLGGNPAGLASEALHRQGLNPAEVDTATYDAALAEAKAETEEDHVQVVDAGGLHIIGTERHDSRRIDNQLRGRAGRQGDPGSSRFYLSLDDDLMKRFASDRVTGLMERLGLDEDVAIESKLVSRTIESAQSRVEGFNFDIRKRVVEFDDVINKQRETIYAERDKVLHNEDLTETVQPFLDDEIDALVGEPPRRRGPRGVEPRRAGRGARRRWAWRGEETAAGRRSGTSAAARPSPSTSASSPTRSSRRARPRSARPTGARSSGSSCVRTIDSLWVEHLTELDDMRRGIGLRGYAQQDPLNEFRREAFRMYEEFRDLIRHGVASSIFRVTVQRQPPPGGDGAVAQALAAGRGGASAGSSGNGAGAGSGTAGAAGGAAGDRAAVAGSAILRGSLPTAPAVRNVTESLGDEPVAGRRRAATPGRSAAGGAAARLHADRRADRAQRPVLVRFGRQVQEVPRPLSAPALQGDRPSLSSSSGSWRCIAVAGYAAYRIWDQGGRDERRTGRRDRRHGRGPVRRPPVAAVRGPARSRHRAVPRRRRAAAHRDRRQARGRPDDRGRQRPRLRDQPRRAGRRRSWWRTRSRTTLQSIRGVDALMDEAELAERGVRVRPDAHAARPADGRRRRDRRLRLADAHQPARARSRRGGSTRPSTSSAALGVYFMTGESP